MDCRFFGQAKQKLFIAVDYQINQFWADIRATRRVEHSGRMMLELIHCSLFQAHFVFVVVCRTLWSADYRQRHGRLIAPPPHTHTRNECILVCAKCTVHTYTGFIRGILRGVRYAKSLRVLFLHRRSPSWTTLVLYSRAVFIFNEPTNAL